MRDFDKNFARIQKNVGRIQKFAIGWFCFVAVLSVSVLCGIAWVAYKLLQHFEVI